MRTSFYKLIAKLMILICAIILFLLLDQQVYLRRGISVFRYEILPFNTKLRGDHNVSGYYYFTSRHGSYGYELSPNLYFIGDSLNPSGLCRHPTILFNDPVPRYLSRIESYGYNKQDLIIKACDENNNILYLKPKKNAHDYVSELVAQDDINWNVYHWIHIRSGFTLVALYTWIFLLLFIPIFACLTLLSCFDNRYIYSEDNRAFLSVINHIFYAVFSSIFYFFVYVLIMFCIGIFPFSAPKNIVGVIIILYWIAVLIMKFLGHRHIYMWYDKDYPKHIKCKCCALEANLCRKDIYNGYLEYHHRSTLLARFLRPRLHLHCPNCGLDEIVCPYCDKPISENDKKCPHCGKRVL